MWQLIVELMEDSMLLVDFEKLPESVGEVNSFRLSTMLDVYDSLFV